MKKLFLILLIFLSANSCIQNADETEEGDEIALTERHTNDGTRSLSAPTSISAISYPDYIEVSLSNSSGDVVIRIYNDANDVVYADSVASSQSSLLINTASLACGTYRIEFTDSQGTYLEGYFVIG